MQECASLKKDLSLFRDDPMSNAATTKTMLPIGATVALRGKSGDAFYSVSQ
jgi:hypothetical protein